jgi:hypothetical protein
MSPEVRQLGLQNVQCYEPVHDVLHCISLSHHILCVLPPVLHRTCAALTTQFWLQAPLELVRCMRFKWAAHL